eukprot:356634-Chlamydomonas_euryale.AAC.6
MHVKGGEWPGRPRRQCQPCRGREWSLQVEEGGWPGRNGVGSGGCRLTRELGQGGQSGSVSHAGGWGWSTSGVCP